MGAAALVAANGDGSASPDQSDQASEDRGQGKGFGLLRFDSSSQRNNPYLAMHKQQKTAQFRKSSASMEQRSNSILSSDKVQNAVGPFNSRVPTGDRDQHWAASHQLP